VATTAWLEFALALTPGMYIMYILYMPQLHLTVDQETASRLEREARARGMSVSKYLATLLARAIPGTWPEGYLDRVVGSFADEPLAEPPDLPLDDVDLRS
jgi:hypothetical protein